MILLSLLVGSTVLGTGFATNSKQAFANGNVYVTIFQPNGTPFFDSVTFEVQLPHGSIQQVDNRSSKAEISDGISSVMSCSHQPIARSTSEVWIAGCMEDSPGHIFHDVFFVRDSRTGKTVLQTNLSHPRIEGFVWAPNSDAVAVLTSTSYSSLNPKYWFSALSGHPKQFEKYRLEIVEIQGGSHWGINVPYESSAGYAEIGGWQQK